MCCDHSSDADPQQLTDFPAPRNLLSRNSHKALEELWVLPFFKGIGQLLHLTDANPQKVLSYLLMKGKK